MARNRVEIWGRVVTADGERPVYRAIVGGVTVGTWWAPTPWGRWEALADASTFRYVGRNYA